MSFPSQNKTITLTSKTTLYLKDTNGKPTGETISPNTSFDVVVDEKMTEHVLFSSKPIEVISQLAEQKATILKDELNSANWKYTDK